MAVKDKNGNWIDGKGDTVPARYVGKYEKLQDRVVCRLVKEAKKKSAALSKLKLSAFESIEKFMADAEKLYGMKIRTEKGNKVLTDFSNTVKIEIKVNNIIDFDDRLQMAKTIIDDLLKKWTEGSRDEVKIMIERAFQVDKKGKLNKDRILDLRTIKIKNQEWMKAMGLIDECIRIVGKRSYILFSEKNDKGVWGSVPLDIARL